MHIISCCWRKVQTMFKLIWTLAWWLSLSLDFTTLLSKDLVSPAFISSDFKCHNIPVCKLDCYSSLGYKHMNTRTFQLTIKSFVLQNVNVIGGKLISLVSVNTNTSWEKLDSRKQVSSWENGEYFMTIFGKLLFCSGMKKKVKPG